MKRLIVLGLIFLMACTTVTPTQSEIEIAAATSTDIPIPTAPPILQSTPAISNTPTLVSVSASLPLADITARLAETSRRYSAHSETDAIKVAQALGFLGYSGHPANMCGPLSAAELRDVGLLPDYVNLHDFWLLDPRDKRYLLDQFFPPDYFIDKFYETPIHRFNFHNFPLQVGDFVYIYQGGEGNFEHMLVVTRVDETGRAYSVTNVHTWDDKYIITEAMLYDPNNVGVGQFYDWATLDNPIGMVTGYGGFEVWRPIKSPRVISEQEKTFAEQVDALFKNDASTRALITRSNDVIYARYSDQPINFDEAINLPLVMLFFATLDLKDVSPSDYQRYLAQTGYDVILQSLLGQADPHATDELLAFIRVEKVNWRATLTSWGAPSTDLDYRRTTAADIETLLRKLYTGNLLNATARQIILDNVTQRDKPVYSFPLDKGRAVLIEINGEVYSAVMLSGEQVMFDETIRLLSDFVK